MLRRLSGRFGRRGTWLIILGFVWVLFGLGVLLDPTPVRSWVLYQQVPLGVEAFCWALTGGIAIWQGWQGVDHDDTPGHVALYVMPAVRVVCFALSWVLWLVSEVLVRLDMAHCSIGWSGGWYAAVVWALVSLMLRLIADWPNPSRPIPHPPVGAAGDD